MGKKFFCDYCERTIPDNVDSRKKHNSGHQHRLAKKLYYDTYKTISEKYHDELKKSKCKRFFSGNECAYGDNCIFSHMTEPDLLRLKNQADLESRPECETVNLNGWKRDLEKSDDDELHRNATFQIIRNYSANIIKEGHAGDLPPSLCPITIRDFDAHLIYNHWG